MRYTYTYIVRYTYVGYGTNRAYRALTIMIAIYGKNLTEGSSLGQAVDL